MDGGDLVRAADFLKFVVVTRKDTQEMEYRTLGRSGCAVSTLALGTMTFGNEADEDTAWASSTGSLRSEVP